MIQYVFYVLGLLQTINERMTNDAQKNFSFPILVSLMICSLLQSKELIKIMLVEIL